MFYALQVGRVDLTHAASRGIVDASNARDIVDRILAIRYAGTIDTIGVIAVDGDIADTAYVAVVASSDPLTPIQRGTFQRTPIDAVAASDILANQTRWVTL